MLACEIRILGRGPHASKTHPFSNGAGGCARAARHGGLARLGQAHRHVGARPAPFGADRAHVPRQGRARFGDGAHRGLVALQAEQSRLPGRSRPRPCLAGAPAQRRCDPEGHDAERRQRALPRPAGRGELGVGPRGPRLHVPARSAGGRRPGHADRARHARTCRRRRAARRCRGCARRCGAPALARGGGRGRELVHGQARRHAVANRRRVQAARGDARADARCTVRRATRTRSTATT